MVNKFCKISRWSLNQACGNHPRHCKDFTHRHQVEALMELVAILRELEYFIISNSEVQSLVGDVQFGVAEARDGVP